MSMTDVEIKQWVENFVTTNPGYSWDEWNTETFGVGLHHKFDVQLLDFQSMYDAKLRRLYQHYKELREGYYFNVSPSFAETTSEDAIKNLKDIIMLD